MIFISFYRDRILPIIYVSETEFQICPNPVLGKLKLTEIEPCILIIFKYIFKTHNIIVDISKSCLHKALTCFTERSQIIYEIFPNSFGKGAVDLLLSV